MNYQTTVYCLFFVILSACAGEPPVSASDEDEKQRLEQENEALREENNRLKKKVSADSIQLQNLEEQLDQLSPEEPSAEAAPRSAIREGQHSFTLQWIGWEKPGTVDISLLANDTYTIKGQQQSDENDDYVSIDGELTVLDEKTLRFTGKLVSRVSYLNGGEACARESPVHFKITGNRKYWRLQEKYNCEGDGTLDYIDIYF